MLRDVICVYCNICTDLDLCRDPSLQARTSVCVRVCVCDWRVWHSLQWCCEVKRGFTCDLYAARTVRGAERRLQSQEPVQFPLMAQLIKHASRYRNWPCTLRISLDTLA